MDSISSTLTTLDQCQYRAEEAQKDCRTLGISPKDAEYDKTWKAQGMITLSFDECGRPDKAKAARQNL
jgi:hypothetical protein